MLLHLVDKNIWLFENSLSSWNFSYKSRNKSMKSISTNGKPNLYLTLMKKTLLDAVHHKNYIKTMPTKEVLSPSTAAGVCLHVGNSDRDNAQQMPVVLLKINITVQFLILTWMSF
jgi:hypothetical protein